MFRQHGIVRNYIVSFSYIEIIKSKKVESCKINKKLDRGKWERLTKNLKEESETDYKIKKRKVRKKKKVERGKWNRLQN